MSLVPVEGSGLTRAPGEYGTGLCARETTGVFAEAPQTPPRRGFSGSGPETSLSSSNMYCARVDKTINVSLACRQLSDPSNEHRVFAWGNYWKKSREKHLDMPEDRDRHGQTPHLRDHEPTAPWKRQDPDRKNQRGPGNANLQHRVRPGRPDVLSCLNGLPPRLASAAGRRRSVWRCTWTGSTWTKSLSKCSQESG